MYFPQKKKKTKKEKESVPKLGCALKKGWLTRHS
jgi:hypothetical protein